MPLGPLKFPRGLSDPKLLEDVRIHARELQLGSSAAGTGDIVPVNGPPVKGFGLRIPSIFGGGTASIRVPEPFDGAGGRILGSVRVPSTADAAQTLDGAVGAVSGVLGGIAGALNGAATLVRWSPFIVVAGLAIWGYGQVKS